MPPPSPVKEKHWAEKLSRSGYFFGALLLHLIVFFMVATWVVFPAFHPPTEDFRKTYLPPASSQPPPPLSQPPIQVPTHPAASAPSTAIVAPTAMAPTFVIPMPNITPATIQVGTQNTMPVRPAPKPGALPTERLAQIMATEQGWKRERNNIVEANSDPHNVVATFPVYLASYANGDWGCNVHMTGGKIDSGSLPNLIAKMNEWSKGHITGEVVPTPLKIGGPDLLAKKPPFIFFTGHKDFKLTDQEIQNLRDYLQVGGAIWGDNALAGRGSRFDIAFRREMKLVVPDKDKNFEPLPLDADIYTKSWFPIAKIPEGMNYYAESAEHLDIDGKLAILYTPNDYSDMFSMRILPGDAQLQPAFIDPKTKSPLVTPDIFLRNKDVFFRNFTLPGCLACDQFGMNVIGYLLVRFDKDLLMTP